MFERKDLAPAHVAAPLEILTEWIGPPFVEASEVDAFFGLDTGAVATAATRRWQLGAKRLKTLHRLIETLRIRGVDVSTLEARVPTTTVVRWLEEKGERFVLELPSGRLGLYTGITSSMVVEKRFARAGVVNGARLGSKTLLWMGNAVKWSKPRACSATGLYAGDSTYLRAVCEASSGQLSDALTLPKRGVGELVHLSERDPAIVVVTWHSDDVSRSFGTDEHGAVVAVLLTGGR